MSDLSLVQVKQICETEIQSSYPFYPSLVMSQFWEMNYDKNFADIRDGNIEMYWERNLTYLLLVLEEIDCIESESTSESNLSKEN